jgi:hypothetical protein
MFFDLTGSYDASFVLSAVLFLLAAIVGALASTANTPQHKLHAAWSRVTQRPPPVVQSVELFDRVRDKQGSPIKTITTDEQAATGFVPLPAVLEEDELRRAKSPAMQL